jgi:hypothetical protein
MTEGVWDWRGRGGGWRETLGFTVKKNSNFFVNSRSFEKKNLLM